MVRFYGASSAIGEKVRQGGLGCCLIGPKAKKTPIPHTTQLKASKQSKAKATRGPPIIESEIRISSLHPTLIVLPFRSSPSPPSHPLPLLIRACLRAKEVIKKSWPRAKKTTHRRKRNKTKSLPKTSFGVTLRLDFVPRLWLIFALPLPHPPPRPHRYRPEPWTMLVTWDSCWE